MIAMKGVKSQNSFMQRKTVDVMPLTVCTSDKLMLEVYYEYLYAE